MTTFPSPRIAAPKRARAQTPEQSSSSPSAGPSALPSRAAAPLRHAAARLAPAPPAVPPAPGSRAAEHSASRSRAGHFLLHAHHDAEREEEHGRKRGRHRPARAVRERRTPPGADADGAPRGGADRVVDARPKAPRSRARGSARAALRRAAQSSPTALRSLSIAYRSRLFAASSLVPVASAISATVMSASWCSRNASRCAGGQRGDRGLEPPQRLARLARCGAARRTGPPVGFDHRTRPLRFRAATIARPFVRQWSIRRLCATV